MSLLAGSLFWLGMMLSLAFLPIAFFRRARHAATSPMPAIGHLGGGRLSDSDACRLDLSEDEHGCDLVDEFPQPCRFLRAVSADLVEMAAREPHGIRPSQRVSLSRFSRRGRSGGNCVPGKNGFLGMSGRLLATIGLLWLSGKNMGEAARLWIILMPVSRVDRRAIVRTPPAAGARLTRAGGPAIVESRTGLVR